jgi:ABC-type uncharacterized transport system permease subunit
MPPLMVIERKMFHITHGRGAADAHALHRAVSWNLFSVENIDKAVLSIIAWFVYIVLLWGHYHEGWRGRRVVWFNVAGAGILTLAYLAAASYSNLLAKTKEFPWNTSTTTLIVILIVMVVISAYFSARKPA